MIRVRFIKYGASTAFGEFGPGTIARVSEALGAHFVRELGVAEYLVETAAPAAEPALEPIPPARKGRRK